ncbi:3-methyl-2-oxobutanoate hydroxymethyltransferase [Naegleria gruberi]|uniref:3-methyl-2-oxobutanoate hydroxymethyltransferase n=1 Tax=Naegleria gruberi TaxID=5762 RepID=D2W044_NAEGR|nr:3-methyl-2-oxobutanoate hydroxymethyltransferase [Naegleria gruberi]EFC37549.1 3-methyl-2-oxobutanoate hydroxymethyltransferase [Naegleria gruberi]|eukprot:XP_002670293.1 3-methyl-2-oxobutanoate hydroxymethyltransferase [Naegleria gruberi strain NEG-M]
MKMITKIGGGLVRKSLGRDDVLSLLNLVQSTRKSWVSSTINGKKTIRNYSVHTSPKSNKASSQEKESIRQELVPVTLQCINYKYQNQIPLTMLTATDFHSASVVDQTNCDMILVGDSLSMTALGQPNTTSVTMDEMIHHAKAVKRGSQYSFLIGDMPFGSYVTDDAAVHNAVRFIKEAEMNSVKLEGGERVASKIKSIVDAGIVVIAHIGLTPQSCNQLGGFRVVGSKNCSEAIQLWKDALAVKEAGASLIVLECVPQKLASLITKHIGIPTIGIGSGKCSGQVLVYHDLLGMYSKFTPKFCKQYLNLNPIMIDACENYVKDVVNGEFPHKSHTFIIKDDVYSVVSEYIEKDVKNHQVNEIIKSNVDGKKDGQLGVDYNNVGERPKVLILGSGSVGSLFASSLSSNCDVKLLSGKKTKLEENIEISTQVREGNETKSIRNTIVNIISDEELKNAWNGEIDVLIIAVKSYATNQAIQNMMEGLPSLSKIKHIITVQNGYGNEQNILTSLSKLNLEGVSMSPINLYSGVKTILNSEDRRVLEQSNTDKISISVPKLLVDTKLGNVFSNNSQFQIGSILNSTIIDGKPKFVDWMKLIINSTINPLASLYQIENGNLLQNLALQNLMKILIKEQVNILRMIPGAIDSLATAQEMKDKSIEQVVYEKVMKICELTSSNRCSMLVDLENQNETEIMYLNGAFVELANKFKIDSPSNKMIVELITAKQVK